MYIDYNNKVPEVTNTRSYGGSQFGFGTYSDFGRSSTDDDDDEEDDSEESDDPDLPDGISREERMIRLAGYEAAQMADSREEIPEAVDEIVTEHELRYCASKVHEYCVEEFDD